MGHKTFPTGVLPLSASRILTEGLVLDRDGIRGKGDGPGSPDAGMEPVRKAREAAAVARKTYNDARNELNELKKKGFHPSDGQIKLVKDKINKALRDQARARKELSKLGALEISKKPLAREIKKGLALPPGAKPAPGDQFKPKAAPIPAPGVAEVRARAEQRAKFIAEDAERRRIAELLKDVPAQAVPPLPVGVRSSFMDSPIDGTNAPVPLGVNGGVNSTYKVTMQDGSQGFYKTLNGEHIGGWKGTMAYREVAAYELDQALGFGLVPETKIVEGPHGTGSVQKAVPGGIMGMNADWSKLAKTEESQLQVARAVAFDAITANVDRHGGNYMQDVNGNLALIDNGMTFGSSDQLDEWGPRDNAMQQAAGRVSPEVSERVRGEVARMLKSREDLADALDFVGGGKLKSEHIDPMFERAEAISKDVHWLRNNTISGKGPHGPAILEILKKAQEGIGDLFPSEIKRAERDAAALRRLAGDMI